MAGTWRESTGVPPRWPDRRTAEGVVVVAGGGDDCVDAGTGVGCQDAGGDGCEIIARMGGGDCCANAIAEGWVIARTGGGRIG